MSFLDGREVRQHPSKPPLVDIGHIRPLRLCLDGFLGLFLRADKENFLPLSNRTAYKFIRDIEIFHGLLQVYDVNAVSCPEYIGLHLGVPFVGLMTEVNPRLQQQFH